MSYVKTSVGYRRRSKRSRVRKRRVFAFALIVTLATLTAWLWNDGRGGALGHGVSAKSPTTIAPLSVQAPRWTNSQRLALDSALRGAFAPALDGAASWSLAVVGPDDQMIYDDRSSDAVAPASVQKLIVAASALDALGPNYRYHTVFAAREPAGDGVLEGNLWLAGSGDPSLQSSDVRNGIAVLWRSGLRRIDGSVVVDATAMSGPAYNPHWGADDAGQDYAVPTSAISLDGDTIESSDDGQPVWTPMQDVQRYVAGQTQEMLRARGVLVSTLPGVGAAPLGTVVLWNHKSAPLRELETHMLFVSDNHYAEQLLRTVGQEVTGESSDDGGVDAERLFLTRVGIPSPGLRLLDGSGLSRSNRVAAITVARLLVAEEPSLYGLLPRGGRDGTLADYDFTTALGRVRAKSGHLSNVSSLAGYVSTLHHGRVAFAFLIDGSPADPDASIVRAVDRLVEY
jgi:D-alanyl-D-alanine carboxypeptidase/D-alanyl-D-alanine-endopeptidase (penicillin-binding protein 4)